MRHETFRCRQRPPYRRPLKARGLLIFLTLAQAGFLFFLPFSSMASCISESLKSTRPPLEEMRECDAPKWQFVPDKEIPCGQSRTVFYTLFGPNPTSCNPQQRGIRDFVTVTQTPQSQDRTYVFMKAPIANVQQYIFVDSQDPETVREATQQLLSSVLTKLNPQSTDADDDER